MSVAAKTFRKKPIALLAVVFIVGLSLLVSIYFQRAERVCLPLLAEIDKKVNSLGMYACFDGVVAAGNIDKFFDENEENRKLKRLIDATATPESSARDQHFYGPNLDMNGKISRARLTQKHWKTISHKVPLFKVYIGDAIKVFFRGKVKGEEFYFRVRFVNQANSYKLDFSQDDLDGEQILRNWARYARSAESDYLTETSEIWKLERQNGKQCWISEGWCLYFSQKAILNEKETRGEVVEIWEKIRAKFLSKNSEIVGGILDSESKRRFLPQNSTGPSITTEQFETTIDYLASSKPRAFLNSGSFYVLYLEPRGVDGSYRDKFFSDAVFPLFFLVSDTKGPLVFNLWVENSLKNIFDARNFFSSGQT